MRVNEGLFIEFSHGLHTIIWPSLYVDKLRSEKKVLHTLIKTLHVVDWVTEKLSHVAAVAVTAATFISAGNAFVRYGFDITSNGWLEIQWYLFAATVMLGGPYVLKVNEHVRVDIFYGKLKGFGPAYIDLFGLIFFLLPVCGLMVYLTWPFFLNMYHSGEMSSNAGGLIRWPAMLLLPVGFSLMFIQGLAEAIKRLLYINGVIKLDILYAKPLQ